MKFSVYIAQTVDGFIARKDGSLDWLPGSDGSTVEEDLGYDEFYASVDTLVMGRHTFEWLLAFGEWPYAQKRVLVLSSTLNSSPEGLQGKVEIVSKTPGEIYQYLKSSGAKHVYVDGGKTIQRFLNEGLIDEMTVTTVPVLIGEGISLFGPLDKDISLKLLHSASFQNGMLQCKYSLA